MEPTQEPLEFTKSQVLQVHNIGFIDGLHSAAKAIDLVIEKISATPDLGRHVIPALRAVANSFHSVTEESLKEPPHADTILPPI